MNYKFVNYAHRGASEYLPENTMLSFYTGLYMGANGIETDIQRTKDGTLVLFHDSTLQRVTGETGSVSDYTFEELQHFFVKKNGHCDKIVKFEDFLQHFSFRDITFAIELKGAGVELDTADLLRKYNMAEKTVVTSFHFDYIQKLREYAPEFEIGWLVKEVTDENLAALKELKAEEICPLAETLTKEQVDTWHAAGLRVRAWGISDQNIMRHAYDCGVDGMTVNFPDCLTELIRTQK